MAEAKALVEETAQDLRITWEVAPYSMELLYEKPTSEVNADGEGLGMDIVHDLDEQQLEFMYKQEQKLMDASGGSPAAGRIAVSEQLAEDENDDGDDEDEDEFEEYDEEDEDDDAHEEQINFEVNLTAQGKPGMGLICMAGHNNRLYVEEIRMGSAAEVPPLSFSSLSEDVQNRLYDFLDSVKIDDRLGFYMRRRYYRSKRIAAHDTLSALAELVTVDAKGRK